MRLSYQALMVGMAASLLMTACSSGGGSSCDPVDLGLEGTWQSSLCEQTASGSEYSTITFTATDVEISSIKYSDSSCGTPDTGAVGSPITGTYTVGCPVTTTTGVTAYELDAVADADGLTYMDLVRVENNDTMYLSGSASTSSRPQSLNFNKTYMRQ